MLGRRLNRDGFPPASSLALQAGRLINIGIVTFEITALVIDDADLIGEGSDEGTVFSKTSFKVFQFFAKRERYVIATSSQTNIHK